MFATNVNAIAILNGCRYGQVRHLAEPLNWNRCFVGGGATSRTVCPRNGTYQNGAFWATPLHYLVAAAQNVQEEVPSAIDFAKSVLNSTLDYYRGRQPGGAWQGVNECVDPPLSYHGVDGYVASGTNVLAAMRRLYNVS